MKHTVTAFRSLGLLLAAAWCQPIAAQPPRVVDAVGLLEGSKSLTAADRRGLQLWFTQFLRWMRESRFGRDEAAAKNNHGTYYDLQAASFSLFIGRRELARSILAAARTKRVAAQIEPDGSQPLELARTRSWNYSVGNLDGLMQLAVLGESVRIDLWHYRTPDGRGIRAALDYLTPYALGERRWPHQQIGEWSTTSLFPLMRRAAPKYGDEQYRRAVSKLPPLDRADRARLLPPQAARGASLRRRLRARGKSVGAGLVPAREDTITSTSNQS